MTQAAMRPPGKIYLQYYDEDIPETTWCEDKINDTDVEYIRKDLVVAQADAYQRGYKDGFGDGYSEAKKDYK